MELNLINRRYAASLSKKIGASAFAFTLLFSVQIPVHSATVEGKKGLIQLGSQAPKFSLPDTVSGKTVSLDDFAEKKALLVIVLCRHCPYVQHVKKGIAQLAEDYEGKDLTIVGISANDPAAVPADAPQSLKEMALEEGYNFSVLFDETQDTAKAYTAVATPDFFLFDQNRRLVYRGQFDNSRPGSDKPVTGQDVRSAIDAVLEGREVPRGQKPSFGCSVKWKRGNEPKYF